MTTMYKTIASERTASGATLDFYTLFDMFSNDWSVLGCTLDLRLPIATLASSTAPTFTDIYDMWFEMPTYVLDSSFGELEAVLQLRIEAYADAIPVGTGMRITNSDASIFSPTVVVTTTGDYALQALMTLVFPAASIPTGRTKIKLQAFWFATSPGGDTLFMKRAPLAAMTSDCEFHIRVKP